MIWTIFIIIDSFCKWEKRKNDKEARLWRELIRINMEQEGEANVEDQIKSSKKKESEKR